MKLEFPAAVPEIPVSDIDEALAYYRTCLGFSLDWGPGELGLCLRACTESSLLSGAGGTPASCRREHAVPASEE